MKALHLCRVLVAGCVLASAWASLADRPQPPRPPKPPQIERPPAGMGKYIVILRPVDSADPDKSKGYRSDVDPEIQRRGGKVLTNRDDRRVIFLPRPAVAHLRAHRGVAYVQRVWTGESFDDWEDADLPGARLTTRTESSSASWDSGPYAYDGSGNVKSVGTATLGNLESYGYDALGRLTRATLDGIPRRYTYDSFGNLTKVVTGTGQAERVEDTPAIQTSNRLSGEAYDVAGNMVTHEGRLAYQYDSAGMVTTVNRLQFGAARRMIYTADDERIGVVLDESTAYWSIRDFQGQVLREFLDNDWLAGPWIWRQDYVYAGSTALGARREDYHGGRMNFHYDHLGSVRMITTNTGGLIALHDFEPFGRERTDSVQEWQAGFERDPEAKKFTGHQRDFLGVMNWDSDDYIDYMHARYYDPNLGRFLSVDPGGFYPERPQSWNRYAYTSNNPINKIDPDGRDEVGFGKQTVTVFTGEVLVVNSPSGGLHVATYMMSGPKGEVFVYDSTSARNQDLSALTQRTTRGLTDNTGSSHRAHNLAAPTVNGKANAFSPEQGATILGVVHANRNVGVGELAEVAPSVKMFHQSNSDGNKQCTDFVRALADAVGYKLVGIGAAKKTSEFTDPQVLDQSVVRIK